MSPPVSVKMNWPLRMEVITCLNIANLTGLQHRTKLNTWSYKRAPLKPSLRGQLLLGGLGQAVHSLGARGERWWNVWLCGATRDPNKRYIIGRYEEAIKYDVTAALSGASTMQVLQLIFPRYDLFLHLHNSSEWSFARLRSVVWHTARHDSSPALQVTMGEWEHTHIPVPQQHDSLFK